MSLELTEHCIQSESHPTRPSVTQRGWIDTSKYQATREAPVGLDIDPPTRRSRGPPLATVDAEHTAVLVGLGVALPMGQRTATYMSALYDLNYDSNGPNPYERPRLFRIGIGVGL